MTSEPKVFISRPLIKLYFNNGFGIYILNSIKFRILPKFYGEIRKDSWEFGFYFLGFIFEVMWNKHFEVKKT